MSSLKTDSLPRSSAIRSCSDILMSLLSQNIHCSQLGSPFRGERDGGCQGSKVRLVSCRAQRDKSNSDNRWLHPALNHCTSLNCEWSDSGRVWPQRRLPSRSGCWSWWTKPRFPGTETETRLVYHGGPTESLRNTSKADLRRIDSLAHDYLPAGLGIDSLKWPQATARAD